MQTVPPSSTFRSIVVYLLTEPWLVTQSLMFCTLTSRWNQFIFFCLCVCFLERNLSVVTSECCLFIPDIFIFDLSVNSTYRGSCQLDEDVVTDCSCESDLQFCVNGSVTFLCFLSGITVREKKKQKNNCNKRNVWTLWGPCYDDNRSVL